MRIATQSRGRAKPHSSPAWRLLTPSFVAVVTIAVVFLPLTLPYDLSVFIRVGHALLHGRQVYPKVGTAAVYSGSAFVYPYLTAWPFALLASVPFGLGAGVFFVLSAGAVTVASLVASDWDRWAPVVILGAAFAITGLQLGALSPLLFAGVIFLWKLRDRPLGFALLAGPVVACKLFLFPLLVWPLLARRRRAFGYALVSAIGLLAAGFALSPLGPLQYEQLLSALGSHEARAGFGLGGALINIGLTASTAQVISIVVAVAVLGAGYVRYTRTGEERVLFFGGVVASLVASPVLWSHYLVLVFAALLVARAPRRWLLVAALASWAIAPPHGVHLDTDIIDGIDSSSTWLLVAAVSVAALASSSGRAGWRRGHDKAI